jgi:hypothetical protein
MAMLHILLLLLMVTSYNNSLVVGYTVHSILLVDGFILRTLPGLKGQNAFRTFQSFNHLSLRFTFEFILPLSFVRAASVNKVL